MKEDLDSDKLTDYPVLRDLQVTVQN